MEIDAYLEAQIQNGASDLHFSAGNPALLRMSGELRPLTREPLTKELTARVLLGMLTSDQRAYFERTHDIDFAYEPVGINARFRANIFLGRLGICGVFRMIPSKILTAQQLNLPPTVLQLAKLKKGLVLVTGATGSGKSTTLAAMVDHINKTRHEHILTVEDPIEFVHQSDQSLVNQREVRVHTESFAAALRSALREDPDVILVGEMRDLETIELAITAAETGHLVFGTLHTSSAAKAVDRMVNVFPGDRQNQIRAMLADSLKGVIAQNLLRTVDGKRVAALEIMVGTPSIAALIRDARAHQIPSAIQTSRRDGMMLMDESIRALVQAGRVYQDEASKYLSPETLMRQVTGGAVETPLPPSR